jgi:hypothetical protein
MKKAKIMLTAIIVLTIVGGSLALKTRDERGTIYCAQAVSPLYCNVATPDYTLINNGTNAIQSPCVESSQYATCTSVSIYAAF